MTQITVLEQLPFSFNQSGTGVQQRQRIYILPTRYGLFFAVLLLVMLIGAINYTNSMAYALTFLLAGLLVVSMLHTCYNLRGLLISTPAARPVFAGEPLRLPLLLDNQAGPRRIALGIELSKSRTVKGKGRQKPITAEPLDVNLNAGVIMPAHLLIKTLNRGALRPGRLRIASCFPLGLFRAWSYIESDQTCIVYPRPAGVHEIPVSTVYGMAELQGRQSGADDFTGFKPYQPGDSIRNIDWKAYARHQPLQVKRFSGSGAGKLILSWDNCHPQANTEQRLSQLCLWLLGAEQDGYFYSLVIPGASVDPGRGEAHLRRCLTLLATYGQTDQVDE